MSQLSTMLAQYSSFICSALALGLALAIYFAFRFRINFWWLNFWYSIALVGKLARLARDSTRSSNPGWLRSEETLCGDYRLFIAATSEVEFRRRLVYLRKAQDIGRKPLPGWMVAILILLLIAEGLGFSYLLGKWLTRDGSANVHTALMLAIVLVICIIMIFLTHAAGHQLYRTGLVRRSDKEWRDNGQQGDFRTVEVMLDDDQSADDRAPGFTQTVNRVGTTGGYTMVAIAVIAIAAIAGISTWMRVSELNQEMLRENTVQTNSNPFASAAATAELSEPQQAADQKAKVEAMESERSEGWAAFIMLAIIFVVTQIVGIFTGYKYGFGAKQGAVAYKGTSGFATYDDYLNHIDPIIYAAQAKLQTLQGKLTAMHGNVKLHLAKTFEDYIRETEVRRSVRRKGLVEGAPLSSPSTNAAGAASSASPLQSSLDEAILRLSKLRSSEEKKEFIVSLPTDTRDEVIKHLKAEKQKQAEAKMRDLNDDLTGLI